MTLDFGSQLKKRILILDGAMGTILQKSGMQTGECPEIYGLNNPAVLEDIHYQYIQAGSDIIQTNTFGANRLKLAEYGLENRVNDINQEAVFTAKRSAQGKALVAASIGPTGKLLSPLGDADFDLIYEAYKEQAIACERAGADLLSIETMTDIGEMRIALIAARYNTRLPVIAHMTFETGGFTMMGTDPITALIIMEAFQPLAIGANCSGGAKELLPVIEIMGRYSGCYLSVEPNAGLPALIDDQTVFPDSPEEMAEYAIRLRDAGANIIGGCCGTTPEHIQAIARVLKSLSPVSRKNKKIMALASRTNKVILGDEYPLAYIGERINPTARKQLAEDIKAGQMQVVTEEARKQAEIGAPVLDVNMGVPGIDEALAMEKAILNIQAAVDIPLTIDSADINALEKGLKSFVGRALINSTTGEEKKMREVFPLAKKYGAAILGLCLDENGIPDKAEGRVAIARKIYQRAKEYGLRDEDIFIDTLVKTASAEQNQVMETIKALQIIKTELKVGTVLGVSNVSHGLPGRDIINSAYLAMAWAAGLDLPIINPFDEKMMDVTRAAAVLLNRDRNSAAFISKYKDINSADNRPPTVRHQICINCNIPELVGRHNVIAEAKIAEQPFIEATSVEQKLKKAVLEGNKEIIAGLLEKALHEDKIAPLDIVNGGLIPGIEMAGDLYDRKQYFLPQLLRAAETMKEAFAIVKPYLAEDAEQTLGVIVLATVEGDIHDIGKNIVGVMLENYGFKVIDLGKDIKAADIVDAAEKEKADIIGLSALMTTTMPKMKEVIQEVKERGLKCRVMVGGAVLTEEYAKSLGADGYSKDARAAVNIARTLLSQEEN
ncbi:MAG TPA: homocysteine S-methyltransferase family protein [Syntrophomonadaceae bacterium]|nr:homocysteine S-methyltransferase family protein [Syntrophomonadaceae bacterium]HPR92650.1 homocysteine S-methyltransferase family protein [Syntrophomonadaceae bacterium]